MSARRRDPQRATLSPHRRAADARPRRPPPWDALVALKALFLAHRPRVHRRHHRQPGRRQVDRRRRADHALPRRRRARRRSVCVDPTSPFSGGAILGDRIRMKAPRARSDGVFIRSLGDCAAISAGCRARRSTSRACSMRWASSACCSRPSASARTRSDVMKCGAHHAWSSPCPASATTSRRSRPGLLEIADVLVVNKVRTAEGADRHRARPAAHASGSCAAADRKDVERSCASIATRGMAEGSGIVGARRGGRARIAWRAWTGAEAERRRRASRAGAHATPRAGARRCWRTAPGARWMHALGGARVNAVAEHRADPWTLAEEPVATL